MEAVVGPQEEENPSTLSINGSPDLGEVPDPIPDSDSPSWPRRLEEREMVGAAKQDPVEQDSMGDEQRREIEARLALPKVPGLDQVAWRISAEDEGEIRWRLSEPLLASITSSGGVGAMLEIAESFGYGALPCRKCGGRWRRRRRLEDGTEVVEGWKDGTGRRPKKHFGVRETYATALARYRTEMKREHRIVIVSKHPEDPVVRAAVEEAFKKRGERVMTEAELRELFPTLPDTNDWTEPCKECKGLGVVPRRGATHAEVTVWPTGSSKRTGAREAVGADELVERAERGSARWLNDGYGVVSLGSLERYLAVEIVLRDVATLSPLARVGIEEYYAPPRRERWEPGKFDPIQVPTGHRALWPLTPAGREPKCSSAAAEKERQARRAREADALYDHMCACWNLAAYGTVAHVDSGEEVES
jgi:hypothetical protein